MGISRVQKFKDYRNSLIKEEAPVLETPKSSSESDQHYDHLDTTSTLPMDEVIKTLNEEDEEAVFIKKQRRMNALKIALFVLAGVILVAGIVVFGILVWR